MTDFVKVDDNLQALNIYYAYDKTGKIVNCKLLLSSYKVVNEKGITDAPLELDGGLYKLKHTYFVFNRKLKAIGRLMKLMEFKTDKSAPYNLVDLGIVYDPYDKTGINNSLYNVDYFITYNKPVFNSVQLYIYTNVIKTKQVTNNNFILSPEKIPDLGFEYVLHFFPSISVMENPYVKYESIQRTCHPSTKESIVFYSNVTDLVTCLNKEYGPNYYPDELKERNYEILFEDKKPYVRTKDRFFQIYLYFMILVVILFFIWFIQNN